MSGRSRTVKVEILGDASNLDEAFGAISEKAGGISSKLGSIAKVGTAALVGVGVAAAGAFVVGFGKAAEAEAGIDRLQAQLGLTGEEAGRLGDVARNVFEGAWGESIPGVLEDINVLRANLGDMSDEDLQRLTEKFLTIEDLWGQPIEETSRTVKTLRDNFDGLTEDQALDIITKGLQDGANFSGDFLDTLNEYSPAFSNIGLSAEQFLGILVAGGEAGAFNIDKVGDAMKEFEIRAQDGSDATHEAFESIGLDADAMGRAIAEGGEAGERGFQATLAALAAIEDPMARNAAGVALFGTQWEDVGEDVVLAMSKGLEGVEGLEGATDRAGEAAYSNLTTAWEGIKRQVIGALTETATPALMYLSEVLNNNAGPAIETIRGLLEEKLMPILRGMGDWFLSVGLPAIQDFATSAADFFNNTLLPAVTDFADFILPKLLALSDWFLNVGLPAIEDFSGTVSGIFNDEIVPAVQGAMDTILPPLQQLADFLQGHGHETLVAFAGAIIGVIVPALILWAVTAGSAAVATIAALLPILGPIALLAAAGAGLALAWETNFGGIQEKTDEVVTALTAFFNDELLPTLESLRATAQTVFAAIKGFVERNFNEIQAIATAVWNQVQLVVVSAMEIIRDTIQLVLALVRGDWSQAWEELQQIAETAKELILGTIENLKDIALNTFEILKNEAWPKFLELKDLAIEQMVALGSWLLNEGGPMLVAQIVSGLAWLVSEAPGGAFHLWVSLNTRITELMLTLGDWLLNEAGPTLVSKLVSGLQNLFSEDNVSGAVGQYVKLNELISDKVGELGDWLLTEGGPTVVSKLVEGLQNLFTLDNAVGVVGQFIKLNTALNETVGTIGLAAVSWGAQIVQGIIDGFANMTGALASAVGSYIVSTVKGAVTSGFGIFSPSKVMKGYGENTVQGFIAGIEVAIEKLVVALKKFTDTIIDALNDSLGIPSPKESEEGYDAGQAVGHGVALGLDDAEPDVARAGGSLGRAAVDSTAEGMAREAGSLGVNAAPNDPPQQVGGAIGAGFGVGVAGGIIGAEPEVHEAGQMVGGSLAKGVQEGIEQEWEGYDATKWFDPDSVVYPPGDIIPETPTTRGLDLSPDSEDGGSTDDPQDHSGHDSAPVGVFSGDGASGGADIFYILGGVSYGVNWNQTNATILNWLYIALERGVTLIRVRNATNLSGAPISKGTHPTASLISALSSAANQDIAFEAAPSAGSLFGGTGGGGAGAFGGGGLNLTVNLGNEQLIDTVLDAPLPGLTLSVGG